MATAPTHTHERAHHLAGQAGELLFILAAFAIALLGGGLLFGLNPFLSAVPAAVLVVSPLVLLAHHRWFERHRDEIVSSPEHHADRERRGY
jgi:hypothetical protein